MERYRTTILSLALALLIIVSALLFPALWDRVEVIFHDLRARLFIRETGREKMEGVDITMEQMDSLLSTFVFIDIDDTSLQEYGRWPWNREVMARFIRKIGEMNPKLVFIDIYYPERSPEDRILDSAAEEAGNVGFVYNFLMKGSSEGYTVDPVTLANIRRWAVPVDVSPNIQGVSRILPTVSPISDHAFLGHDWMMADEDNVFRKVTEYVILDGYLYPSLPVILYMQYKGIPMERLHLEGKDLAVGDRVIPLDDSGRRLVDYYSSYRGYDRFRHISFAHIMSGHAQIDLTNKIAFVGMTARGLASAAKDIKMTPVGEMPGMEYLANATLNIFEGRFIRSVPAWVNAIVILAIALLLSLFSRVSRGWLNILLAGLLFGAFFAAGFILYRHSLYIRMAEPLSAIFVIFLGVTFIKYLREELQKKMIRDMFSSYLSANIVQELLKDPALATLHGQKREMSVLFSDVKSFTTFTEEHPAEEVVQRLNEYLHEMTDVIMSHDGTLDKFVGDEIMALFGAPLAYDDHAERAVKTALGMRRRIKELQETWKARGQDILDMGIGINSGSMLVGNIGAEGKKMDYTVIGDNVNLGARIEGLTRFYKVDILITEETYNLLERTRNHCREIDLVKVKGKNEPTRIYEVMEQPYPDIFLIKFEEGLKAYRNENWDEAERLFQEVLDIQPEDGPARLLLERTETFRITPPPEGWDGSFVMKEK